MAVDVSYTVPAGSSWTLHRTAPERPQSGFGGPSINYAGGGSINFAGTVAEARAPLSGSRLYTSSFGDLNKLRPFVPVTITVNTPVPVKPLLDGEGSPAFIKWGKPSQFEFNAPLTQPFVDGSGNVRGGQTIHWPNPDPDDEDDEKKNETEIIFTEIKDRRKESKPIKIYSEDDPDVYVEIQVILECAFTNNKDGFVRVFKFDPSFAQQGPAPSG